MLPQNMSKIVVGIYKYCENLFIIWYRHKVHQKQRADKLDSVLLYVINVKVPAYRSNSHDEHMTSQL